MEQFLQIVGFVVLLLVLSCLLAFPFLMSIAPGDPLNDDRGTDE